jgi:hypothetical protein
MNKSKELRKVWQKHFRDLVKNNTPIVEALGEVKETALKTWKGTAEGFECQFDLAFKNQKAKQKEPKQLTITVAEAYEMIENADMDCINEIVNQLLSLGFKFFHKTTNESLEYVKTVNEKQDYYCMKFKNDNGKIRESYTHCINRFIVLSND